MIFDPGLKIFVRSAPLGFEYGTGVFGPTPEFRKLDSIRSSLLDPRCDGPDPVYVIAMDVGKEEHRYVLEERMLLFGVVTFSTGRLGNEPVRSQGHVHKISSHSGWSPPELYEIWQGRALIYMQEHDADDPGRCFAVEAGPGEVVVVPPGWPHATISADFRQPLIYGAWCDREYGFLYDGIRTHGGLAWFPTLDSKGDQIQWQPNMKYRVRHLECKRPASYARFGLTDHCSIYELFERNPDLVQWVSKPGLLPELWQDFVP